MATKPQQVPKTIQDRQTREIVAGALSSLRFAGVDLGDLYATDGDRLADELCRLLRRRYRIDAEPSAVLALVAELL